MLDPVVLRPSPLLATQWGLPILASCATVPLAIGWLLGKPVPAWMPALGGLFLAGGTLTLWIINWIRLPRQVVVGETGVAIEYTTWTQAFLWKEVIRARPVPTLFLHFPGGANWDVRLESGLTVELRGTGLSGQDQRLLRQWVDQTLGQRAAREPLLW